MSRPSLTHTDIDRIALAATAIAIAAIVWLILAAFPNPRYAPLLAAEAATARHVDEGNRTASKGADHFPAQPTAA
jgi:hypothetical protein